MRLPGGWRWGFWARPERGDPGAPGATAPYRTEPDLDPPREVPFAALSPETQRSLLGGFSGEGALLLLRERVPLVGSPSGWMTLALGSAVFLAATLLTGFGDLRGGPRPVTHGGTTATALLLGGIVLGAGLAWRAHRLRRNGPFDPGVFLFARDLVDARGPRLRILPTSRIEQILRERGDLVCVFSDGERISFSASKFSVAYLQGELHSLRDLLTRAETDDDRAALTWLDPFVHERPRWHELPQASRRGSSSTLRRPILLVAPALLFGALASWPLSLFTAEQSDLAGIREAAHRKDSDTLAAYIRDVHARYPARKAADDALFALAHQDPGGAGFLAYLKSDGSRAIEASEELFVRLQKKDNRALQLPFLRYGQGPRRDQLDEEILAAALGAEDLRLLEDYAKVGRRGAEIQREVLPRKRIARAFLESNPEVLRGQLAGTSDEAVKQEAREALASLYGAARKRLVAVTGLRTPLARALDGILVHAERHGGWLRIASERRPRWSVAPASEEREEELIDALLVAIRLHVDPSLLQVLRHTHEDRNEPRILVIFEDVQDRGGLLADYRVRLSFRLPEPPEGQPSWPEQAVRFHAPRRPDLANGRSFRGAAQNALTAVLLGDPG
jgi:hypothetical protein